MRSVEMRQMRAAVTRRDPNSRDVGGYALKFNKLSRNLGGFVERIDPGFLAKSEGDGWPEVMARWNHEDAYLLGTIAGGTLRLTVDGVGLDYVVDVPQARDDLLELVTRGDVSRSSFAWHPIDEDWSLTPDGFPLRTLLSGQLIDVAPVNQPAYLDTSTGLRSLAARMDADPADVLALAEAGELARLFKRSDPTPPPAAAPADPPAAGAAESTPATGIQTLRRRLVLSK